MIQQETIIDIADNTGAKTALCIRVLGGSTGRGQFTRRKAKVGDIINVAIKKALPTITLDTKKVHRCVIIRASYPTRRPDGSYVRFDSNAGVLIDKDGNPIGTRIFGAVARELREKNFMKIISLAAEVV
jgi:large subunit ribosomal protein L14